MPIVESRIEKAGIRLAGVLNQIFAKTTIVGDKPAESVTSAPKTIAVTDAPAHYDEQVTVSAKVYGTKDFGSLILVNLGAAYPDSPLSIVLRGDARSLGASLQDKTITVTGKMKKYRDKPEIVVTDQTQVKIN